MRDSSDETRDLDIGGSAEPLAAPSAATCHAADRADLGNRIVERRAGAEPAGARVLRSRSGDLRRRADRDAGRQWRDLFARTVRKTAPRWLAGVAGAGRPRADRRPFLSP